MACFISSSSSEESLCGSTRESTVFSDDEVQQKKVQGRAKRTKKIPAKLRDYVPSISKEEERLQKKEVLMKCSQTGRKIKAKFGDISKKDMTPMTEADLKGSSLVITIHGKSYPVEFLQFVESDNSSSDKRVALKPLASNKRTALEAAKNELESKNCGPPPKKVRMHTVNPLADYHESENLHPETASEKSPLYHSADRNLLVILDKKLDAILERLGKIEDRLTRLEQAPISSHKAATGTVKNEEAESQFVVNGVNLIRMHANNATAYGRMLLDTLFTRQELKDSLLFASKKSEKPALDRAKVELLLECINRRFPEYNQKEIIRNLNQKCRDSGKSVEPIVLH